MKRLVLLLVLLCPGATVAPAYAAGEGVTPPLAGRAADSAELAAALVAPRAKDVSATKLRALRGRTLRILLQGLVRDLAAGTTTTANPRAPLGSFDTGTGALASEPSPLSRLAPPAW